MAKVTPSPLVGSVQGKIGGVCFRGTGSRAVVQMNPQPPKSETAARLQHHTRFAQAAAEWSTMSDDARRAWQTRVDQTDAGTTAAGRPFATGRAAFIAWRLQWLNCRAEPSQLWPVYQPWQYAARFAVTAAVSMGGAFLLWSDNASAPNTAAAWLSPCPALDRFAARPRWSQLLGLPADPVPAWHMSALYPPFNGYLDLRALWLARFPYARPGDTMQLRVEMCAGVTNAYPQQILTFRVV